MAAKKLSLFHPSIHPSIHSLTTDIVYRSPCFTLCYGWRVGIVHPRCHCKRIRDDRYRGGQLVTLPYLTLPYLTLPYLTLPYLTLPYLPHVPYLPDLHYLPHLLAHFQTLGTKQVP